VSVRSLLGGVVGLFVVDLCGGGVADTEEEEEATDVALTLCHRWAGAEVAGCRTCAGEA
jgi:hypothetical protein